MTNVDVARDALAVVQGVLVRRAHRRGGRDVLAVKTGAPSVVAVFTCAATAPYPCVYTRCWFCHVPPSAGIPGWRDLAARDHQHPFLAVDLIAVDVDVEELVVLAEPLQGLEVVPQDGGAPQADVRDRGGVVPDVGRRDGRRQAGGVEVDRVQRRRPSGCRRCCRRCTAPRAGTPAAPHGSAARTRDRPCRAAPTRSPAAPRR